MTREDVVAEAHSWLATPYRHQASVKGLGADCIGFIVGVGVALGLSELIAASRDPACKGYAKTPDATVLMRAVRKYLDPVAIDLAGLGDILVLRFEVEPQHFAIISNLDPLRVIHAYASARKVCENGIDGEWKHGTSWRSLIMSAWRFRGVDD